jgi:hypothetical protein
MKTVEREVKSARSVVAKVETPVYDTLQEAIDKEGEKKVLELFNTQNGTNIMNAARAAATSVPTKAKIKSEIIQDLVDGKLAADAGFNEAKGDPTRLQAWTEAEVERRLAEYKAKLPSPPADDNGDEA